MDDPHTSDTCKSQAPVTSRWFSLVFIFADIWVNRVNLSSTDRGNLAIFDSLACHVFSIFLQNFQEISISIFRLLRYHRLNHFGSTQRILWTFIRDAFFQRHPVHTEFCYLLEFFLQKCRVKMQAIYNVDCRWIPCLQIPNIYSNRL